MESRMKKADLTKRIARTSKMSRAAAADQLDRLVHEILERVRKGEPASLPGLGTFTAGGEGSFGTGERNRKKEKGSK